MTFKKRWEKASHLHELGDREILGMIGVAYPERELLDFEVLSGGCANINIRVDFKGGVGTVLLRVYIRDRDMVYKEQQILAVVGEEVPLFKMYGIYKYRNYTFAILEFLEGILLADYLLEVGRTDFEIETIMLKVGGILSAISKVKPTQNILFSEVGYLSYAKEILCNEGVREYVSSEQIVKVLDAFSGYFPQGEEKNLVHGDFNPANILIKEGDGEYEVSGVLDWEYAFAGSTLADVADMLRYAKDMPKVYEEALLRGLEGGGFNLPSDLQRRIDILNLVTILDCMRRGLTKPILMEDCKRLVEEIVCRLLKQVGIKKIEVIAYDPIWLEQYEKEKEKIYGLLKDSCLNVHHIGSTSVPGLAAKRDLDIILVVDRLKNSLLLQNIGYVYKGEINIPLRYYFSKNSEEVKVNLHVVEKDHGFISLNLAIRDYLRNNKEMREAYQSLKYKILEGEDAGEKVRGRLSKYSLSKDSFIKDIIRKSGFDGLTVNYPFHEKEWEDAACLNGEELLSDGKYFLLYKGAEVVGFAHVDKIIQKMVVPDKEKKYFEDFLLKILL